MYRCVRAEEEASLPSLWCGFPSGGVTGEDDPPRRRQSLTPDSHRAQDTGWVMLQENRTQTPKQKGRTQSLKLSPEASLPQEVRQPPTAPRTSASLPWWGYRKSHLRPRQSPLRACPLSSETPWPLRLSHSHRCAVKTGRDKKTFPTSVKLPFPWKTCSPL